MRLTAQQMELVISARDAIAAVPHGQRGRIAAATAQQLQCSVPTLYRYMADAGLDTGRKKRVDAGSTSMTIDELRLVAGVLATTRRDNDKRLTPIEVALDMLRASGQLKSTLTAGRVSTLLREHHMHPDQLAQQEPAVELRSLHANHVWQIDASTCVLYYLKGGHLKSMDREEFYKNKPHNLARVVSDLCNRYTVADHYSGAFKTRYLMGGESAANLVDFFLWAVCKQEASPMHGAPAIVMMDPGAANKGALFSNLARRMDVRVIINKPGNARAKGAVEKTHDLVERHYEGRFRFFEPEELTYEVINAEAERWAAAYCAQHKHSRHGQTRFGLWMTITPEQLRVPASEAVLRELVTSEPVERRVSNTMQITFAPRAGGGNGSARDYDVSRVPGAVVGGKVRVAMNAYRAPAIDVAYADADSGEECWMVVEPLDRDKAGFRTDGASPVIGQDIRVAAHTEVDRNRNRLVREAYRGLDGGHGLPSLEDAERARKRHAQAYAGVVDPMADVHATPVPTFMPRRGTALEVAVPREVAEVRLSVFDACGRLQAMLGADYSTKIFGWLQQRFGDEGVPESALEAIAQQYRTPEPSQAEGGLRAVGGGQ